MVISCAVVGCTNRNTKSSSIKFHRIPADTERRQKWVQAINRKNWQPKHHGDRVCGEHFVSGCASNDPGDPDYVPHIKMGYTLRGMGSPEEKKARYTRNKKRADDKDCEAATSDTTDKNVVDATVDIHRECQITINKLQCENEQLTIEISRLRVENSDLNVQLNKIRFDDNFLSRGNKDHKTKFYTGVPNYATFMWLVTFCASVLPHSKILSPSSILLMILMKLRLSSQNRDLGYRFGVSLTHISELLNCGIPAVAKKIQFLIYWPAQDDILRRLPKVIRSSYKNCRSIIDCCEIFIERPGNLNARSMTWSNYKHHNTIKVLIAITPEGSISFVSRTFGGRTSDKIITQRSGYLDLLEHGDLILADRGFLISDDLAAHGATLAIPAFTRGKNQLSARDVETTRKLARVRIHVERAIERIKIFRILSTTMNMSLVPHADSVVTICSAISNLNSKLID